MNIRKNCGTGLSKGIMITLLLLLTVATYPVSAADSVMPSTEKVEKNKGRDRYVTIDFNNVDIEVFVKFISELTGKNFVIDNRVKGKVTIISPAKISVEEAYRVFESVLEVHGFAAVPAGKVIKIVPSPDARSKNIETRLAPGMDRTGEKQNDKLITQLIPLKYANAGEIKRLFTPLISKNSAILAYTATNTLIMTDAQSNIKRLLSILKAIDLPGIGQEVSVIPLEYADADKLVKTLQTVFRPEKRIKSSLTTTKQVQFVSDTRTNTIIVMASENELGKIRKLVKILDKETPRGKGKIHVYYLENATAEDVAKVLQELPTKTSAAKGKEAPIVSDAVRVTADKATNSLIIMADAEDYMVLETVIRKLDIPRAMVYIEALFMEVNVEKNFNLGVQWSAFGSTTVDGKTSAIGGGFSADGSVGASDFISADTTTGVAGLVAEGLSLGLISSGINIDVAGQTLTLPNLTAVVNAFQSDEDVHILSTPQVLTTDNEEATIIVGENVAFQTKATVSDAGNETFNSFEYRDVGLTLKITPHISKDRLVRLKISHEFTTIKDPNSALTDRPTTLKRSVDTTVIVQDQNTIVIGGLIDDIFSENDTQVPCLGKLPFFGKLFSSESETKQKTNLYIFITPRVIKNPEEAESVVNIKQEEIDGIREGKIKLYNPVPSDSLEQLKDTLPMPPTETK